MSGIGESNALDFSFEELEFISGGLDELQGDGTVQDPNQMTAEEVAAAEKAEQEAADAEAAAAAGIVKKEDETPEGENPESVGSSSTEEQDLNDGEENSPKLYQTFADILREKGVLSSVDESSLKDVKDIDGIVEAIKKQIESEEYKDLTETQKAVLKDMREGVSEDTAGQFKNAMDKLSSLDDTQIAENKQVRFDLIYQDFLSRGYNREQAIKYANRSFELKADIEDAKEAKGNLVNAITDRYNKAKEAEIKEVKDAEAKIAKDKEDLKNKILTQAKVLEGVDVPEPLRKEVYESMVKTVSNDPKTGIPENALMKYQRENPLEYSHKLYYLFKVTNGFKDLNYFQNKKTTSSVKALETALRQSTHVSGGGNPSFVDDGESHILDIGELVLPGQ